ncbi:hypothetical protein BDM02DRAFT_3116453 [Thelephora ganbajun]|uniref:Uncharacterized protein n=1 Tax=Thelephora ganbajun TaxID=370292 RepID=A0ACB6ZE06_THEGA|nr:hypothetical protein BDM02DRAFT_3116453 [Thelephora ganbajun]
MRPRYVVRPRIMDTKSRKCPGCGGSSRANALPLSDSFLQKLKMKWLLRARSYHNSPRRGILEFDIPMDQASLPALVGRGCYSGCSRTQARLLQVNRSILKSALQILSFWMGQFRKYVQSASA